MRLGLYIPLFDELADHEGVRELFRDLLGAFAETHSTQPLSAR